MFDIDSLKKVEQYKTKWQIQEEKLKIKLTDVFEIDIIELSKAKRQLMQGTFEEPKDIKDWVTFLINPKELEESEMEEMSEEVRKAYELWQSLNLNQEERERAEERFMELASTEYAIEYERKLARRRALREGRKQGIKEGRAQGIKEGKEQGIKEGKEQGIKEGKEQGIKEGKEQGIKEGIEQGKNKKQKEIAKKLLEIGIDTEKIIEATGLTKEEIEN